jgi:hypothetical protein
MPTRLCAGRGVTPSSSRGRDNGHHDSTRPRTGREIALRISEAFATDQRLAVRLNDAEQRLERADSNLWDGAHPDALSLLYDHAHPRGVADEATIHVSVAAQIDDARRAGADAHGVETVALRAVQEIH